MATPNQQGSGPDPPQNQNQEPPVIPQNVNTNPPPPPTPSSHVHVHYSNNPCPKFSGIDEEFTTWKEMVILHVTGIDRNMLKTLNEGPFIPRNPHNAILDPSGSRVGREKREEHWSEEERRLVSHDTLLRTMILGAVPKTMIPTLILYKSAKVLWDELINQYEGGEDTVGTRKVSLNKKYESFFALPNESLTGTYTRFLSIVNQLKALGVEKDKEILLEKFCDILPTKWSHMILVLRQGKTLHTHTLSTLYGAFRFTEENQAQRVEAERDALNHASEQVAVVNNSGPPCAALLSSESVFSMKKMMSDLMDSGVTNNVSPDCDEDDNDDLMAMIAKTFNRFKARANKPSGHSAPSSSIDKTNLTCFKCGRKGHFMKECKSNYHASQSGPSSSYNKSDDGYKQKYKKLKAQIALMAQQIENNNNNKCMVAKEDWTPSDDSSDDDEEVRDCCYMALEDNNHLVKEDVTSGRWVDIVTKKVSNYDLETDPDLKLDIGEELYADLTFVETVRFDGLTSQESDTTENSILKSKLKELQDIELAFKAQVLVTEQLIQEKEELEKVLISEKQVIKSWLESRKPYDAAINQYPSQMRAFQDGNVHAAALIPALDKLPEMARPETIYDEPTTPKSLIIPADIPVAKTGATLVTAPVKKNVKPLLSQTEKKKKKLPSSKPKPEIQSSGKAQVSSESEILLRLESQFQLLARQVQSCNARINNFESTSSDPKPISKPFSKQKKIVSKEKKEKEKVSKLSVPLVFTAPQIEIREIDQIPTGVHPTGSREPITRWVPKSN